MAKPNPKHTTSPYQNPDLASWLDSFEGVPDLTEGQRAPAAPPTHPWSAAVFRALEAVGPMLPGLALAAGFAFLAHHLARFIGVDLMGYPQSPLSAVLLAVLLGLIVRNVFGVPASYDAGLRLCVKRILRIGIALLGIRMSLIAVGWTGLIALPIVLTCIAVALLAVSWINRALHLPARLGSLIAVGTSVCGVSAIVATAPAIDADEDETSYAVATIALFGTLALFAYPFLAQWLFAGDAYHAGLFLGTAIHDTSQVTGAALTYQQQYDAPVALDTAVVTKLLRNTSMVAIIPLMAVLYHRRRARDAAEATGESRPSTLRWHQAVPLFVLGFLGMALLRTTGDFRDGLLMPLTADAWQAGIETILAVSNGCLMLAMAAIGLNTGLSRLRRLGWKPCLVGLAAAALVTITSTALIFLLGPHSPGS